MTDRIGILVIPTGVIGADQIGIHALALNSHDIIVFDTQGHRRFQVALEGQVHISTIQHQRAIHTAIAGVANAQASRPIPKAARLVGYPGTAAPDHTRQADRQVRTGFGANVHDTGIGNQLAANIALALQIRTGFDPFQNLGMLVANHHDAGTFGQQCGTLGRMQQPFYGAVHNELAACQSLDNRVHTFQRQRRPGRAQGNIAFQTWRDQFHMANPCPHLRQGQLSQLGQHGARLRLGQHDCHFAGLYFAQSKHFYKISNPFAFNMLTQHLTTP